MTSRDGKTSVLFVCLGNICRSPAAEAVFTTMVHAEGLSERFRIDSAGTSGYHSGEPADSRMIRHGQNRGYHLKSISRQVQSSDFHDFQYIVAMDNTNYRNLVNLQTEVSGAAQIVKMCDYLKVRREKEVPDPYYEGAEGFEQVYDILEEACQTLLQHLTRGP